MENVNINNIFVSEKVSKIRWIPEHLQEPKRFITGSWDNSGQNSIKLYRLVINDYFKNENEYIPKCVDKIAVTGDITEIININSENFAVSSGDGRVRIVQIKAPSDEYQTINEKEKSEVLHKTRFEKSCSCTGLSIFDENIATVGEDGKLNILSASQLKLIRQMEYTDSCSLTAVSYISHNEVLASNRMGIIKVFDIRANDEDASPVNLIVSYENENKSNFATTLCYHPTQKHIIFAGTEEGSITVWDLRQPNFPASYLSAHSSSITEINFDHSHHTTLFTASEDGELWQWSQNSSDIISQMNKPSTSTSEVQQSDINPWLNGERTKSKVSVTSIITGVGKAVNSFDAYGSKIICGCDNETVYYISNMI